MDKSIVVGVHLSDYQFVELCLYGCCYPCSYICLEVQVKSDKTWKPKLSGILRDKKMGDKLMHCPNNQTQN